MARGSGRPNVKLRSVYNPGLAAVALARPYRVYYLWDQTAEMPRVAMSYHQTLSLSLSGLTLAEEDLPLTMLSLQTPGFGELNKPQDFEGGQSDLAA
jgi:hypothetical protein